MDRIEQLEYAGVRTHVVRQCAVDKERSENAELDAFFRDENLTARLKDPLKPQQAVIGGRVENYVCEMILTEEQRAQGWRIVSSDVVSLYRGSLRRRRANVFSVSVILTCCPICD